jgi:SAM-dependent methyltransferase
MVQTIKFEDQIVPEYITKGNHTRFIKPLALEVCKGAGLDVGCNRLEWCLDGATPVDPVIDPNYNATALPLRYGGWDYIYSSHCLEHVPDYMEALHFWKACLAPKGIIFLYLPHPDCKYWRPWKMPTRKHLHQFYPDQVHDILDSLGFKNVFVSERDLAFSFAAYGQKDE